MWWISVVQGIAMLGVPALIMKIRRTKLVKTIGTVGMSYVLGILVALLFFAINKLGGDVRLDSDVGQIGSHAAIGIAIPLLLFGANLKETRKLGKPVLIAFGSLIVSVVVVTTIMFFTYGRRITDGAELSGMAVGLYTGGTPNLNAIGSIFKLDTNIIGLANLSDMVIGGVFYIFLLLLCKPLLKRFLGEPLQNAYLKDKAEVDNYENLDFKKLDNKKGLILTALLALGMAVLSAAVGLIIWVATGSVDGRMNDYLVPSLLIGVTVFGIIGSFNKKVRAVKGSNFVGQYLLNVFSFGLAMSIDLTLIKDNFLSMLILYGGITVLTFVLQIVVCKFAKIDVDCAIVTLTAGVYGPAFVPAITRQIKNEELTAPGLICGSLGYAIGTFIGLGMGMLFRLFL